MTQKILAGRKGWPSILLARAGAKDPADLDAAVAAGAFGGLRAAVHQGPTGTIAAIGASGLRGRGGSGFVAADKWRAAAITDAERRYVVANGYGADPATTTDQTLIELDPFSVIEGTAIAAWAIGAEEAIIAVRATATEAIRGLEAAVAAATGAGFVGEDVLGSGHRIEIRIAPVQGAYLLGQETILLKALESRRGQPEQTPPYPATRGLHGMPTLVQNVQTLASVPWILRNGAEAFRATGAPGCPGTILVQVRSPETTGIAEIPFGTPLADVVALAGPLPAGRSVKALVVGGPAGGILPPEAQATPYTFDDLRAAGAHVGSGSVIVVDDRACVVDLARILTRFCADEACGKTIPCRIGTRRLSEIGDRLAAGTSRAGDLDLLVDLSADIVASALCDHERLATFPLLSGMRYFRAELDEHLERGVCRAGVCHPIPMAATATH